jgi:hypothetical protein
MNILRKGNYMAETNDRAKLAVLAAAFCWLAPLAVLAITNPLHEENQC